jgi:phosphatidylinositol alpha-1,6-mannosyltransferase
VTHLLVTNDFPPKVGGIQSYLWELWRRLPAGECAVLTLAHEGAPAFDARQPFRIERVDARLLLPSRDLVRRIDRLAADADAAFVLLDPALPLGLVGPRLERPYGVVGRRRGGDGWPIAIVPPGVAGEGCVPLDADERVAARARFGFSVGVPLLVSVSRLVPRKGFDVLIEAAARLATAHPGLEVAVAGTGRDRGRLQRLATRHDAPVRFLGRVADADLPALYACGDVFVMACRNRWAGLEQEGFGIVFLEAAACGVPQVAGESGGASEAVVDGETGYVVRQPARPDELAAAIARLLDDPAQRVRMGKAARARAESEFAYGVLANRLHTVLQTVTPT